MNDLLIFLSFAAFVLSPCFIALRSREQREEARLGAPFGAKLGPRLVPAHAPRSANAPRKQKKLIVDQLPTQRRARREAPRDAAPRHTAPCSPYMPTAPQAYSRRRNDASVFIPPTRRVPALGYTSSPVPALVYGLPQTSADDLLLLVLPGGRAQAQRPLRSY